MAQAKEVVGMADINEVWTRIVAHQGETFRQIRGKEFTYTVKGNVLRPSTTNQNIPRSHFDKALLRMPFESTVPLQDLRGPSYIFAILKDPRICGQEISGLKHGSGEHESCRR